MQKNQILTVYGEEPKAMATQLAKAANLAALIGNPKAKVGLKPNLVLDSPAQMGATTHPEIATGGIYQNAHPG